MKTSSLALCCIAGSLLFSVPAGASTDLSVGPFTLKFFNQGDTLNNPAEGASVPVSRTFTGSEMAAFVEGAQFWADRLAASDTSGSLILGAAFLPDASGSAYNVTPGSDTHPNGRFYNYLTTGTKDATDELYGFDSLIVVQFEYPPIVSHNIVSPLSMTGTVMHEMGHAFGIFVTMEEKEESGSKYWKFAADGAMNNWTKGLVDVFGKQAAPDMKLAISAVDVADSFVILPQDTTPAAFKYPTFHGTEVDALTLNPATGVSEGMAVMAGRLLYDTSGNPAGYGFDGGNTLGHSGIMNSLMSYGAIQNIPFTEVELAMLQDLGYTIDRSQFYGKSILFTPASPVTNGIAFGTETAPKTASFAVGLHIFTDNAAVTQTAGIYTSGASAGGIRIDGVANTLTVAPQTVVSMTGESAAGVTVSYGRDNVINLRGSVQASGEGGYGAHFGFLSNPFSIYSHATFDVSEAGTPDPAERYENSRMNSDLAGALVKALNVTGTLAGTEAAVRIEMDAHVEEINIMKGASLRGDIVSYWNEIIPTAYTTNLTFGRTPDANGAATSVRDATFSLRYDGNVSGAESIHMSLEGGTLSYNGAASVLSMKNYGTLKGNGVFTLAAGQEFYNEGTIAPGNSIGTIQVNGDFTSNGGTFDFEFDGTSRDVLKVSGNAAVTGATASLTPVRGYYGGRVAVSPESFISAGGTTALDFTNIVKNNTLSSNTLSFAYETDPSDGILYFTPARASNAYSRLAAGNENALRAAAAVDTFASHASGDMQNLIATLDFADVATIRQAFVQMTPDVYNSLVQSVFSAARQNSNMMAQHLIAKGGERFVRRANPAEGEWNTFLSAFGGSFRQKGADAIHYDGERAGFFGGIEKEDVFGMTAGFHALASFQKLDADTDIASKAKTASLELGAHMRFAPNIWQGFNVYGSAGLGADYSKVRRPVSFGGYERKNKSEFALLRGSVLFGAGYDIYRPSFTVTPTAFLDFTAVRMPEIKEKDGDGARLRLDDDIYSSLRGSVGLNLAMGLPTTVSVDVGLYWNHEFLDDELSYQARFVEAGGEGAFKASYVNAAGSDSATVNAQIRFPLDLSRNITLGFSGEFYQDDLTILSGMLSYNWTF